MTTSAPPVATAAPLPGALVEVLRRIARTVAESLELQEVFARVAEATRAVVPFDRMGVALIEGAETARLYAVADGEVDGAAPVIEVGTPMPLGSLSPRLWPPAAARLPRRLDAAAELDADFALDREILARGVRSILQARLHGGGGEMLGVLWFASRRSQLYSAEHEAAVGSIADSIALALAHERLARGERERRRRSEALEALLPALASALDTQQVFRQVAAVAREVIPHDFLAFGLLNEERTRVRIYATSEEIAGGMPEIPVNETLLGTIGWQFFLARDMSFLPGTTVLRWHLEGSPAGAAGEAGSFIDHDVGPVLHKIVTGLGARSSLRVPVRLHGEVVGGLNFMSRQPDGFRAEQAELARRIADHVALALAHERLAEEQRRAAEAAERARHLEARIVHLSAELEAGSRRRVVGRSREWRLVLAQATKVAATETNVLLTGESGTGKEVVARFVHRASPRAEGPFVALNCAALPDPLLESELFGHEKGAFTGAAAMKPGSLDQAAGGVLFLDEVGEMSLLVQAKLLRVLEQREFQRLGGTRPIKADLRLVAATNRDLPAAIARGQFREDLYYRLHVFEIRLPPLRERPDDILPLVEAFLEELGATMGRPAAGLSREAKDRLLAHRWPGNVRELRNALERALILCEGGLITGEHLPIALAGGAPAAAIATAGRAAAAVGVAATDAAAAAAAADGPVAASTAAAAPDLPPEGLALDLLERGLIVKALERTHGNRTQAARLLRLTRAQLYTRLARYGLQ